MELSFFPLQEQLNAVNPLILESAAATLSPQWQLKLRGAPYSRLYYFLEGEAWVESGGRRITMQAGNLYLIPAGLPFAAGCRERARKIYFHLNLLKQDGYDLAMEMGEIGCLPVTAQRLERLNALCAAQSLRGALGLKNMIMEDLLAVFERYDVCGAAETGYSMPVRQTVSYIHRHLSVQLSVAELAERAYVSERTLNQMFRREMGKTAGQYIDEMLLFEAQRQLLLTFRPIGEISESLGYCDPFYFSRRFKELSGRTPSAYRKEGRPG